MERGVQYLDIIPHLLFKMPKKQTKQTKKTLSRSTRNFFDKRPIVGYIILTIGMMLVVLMMEKGTEFYQASILKVPEFNGTALPIRDVPNWRKTGGKNDMLYESYSRSELINLPKYDPKKLEENCDTDTSYMNACITYSTVYMGDYHMDHKEYAGSHLAVDIRIPKGTPVYAVANGVVDKAVEKNTGFGRYIVLKHPHSPLVGGGEDTLYSAYAHLSRLSVVEGVLVKKGDLIGYSGDTGISTTPHLHFQIDRSSAPYHPWWPFSSAQASAAGISFFDGINSGLGQSDAIKNTINPMPWVQEFLDHAPSTLSEEYDTQENVSEGTRQVGKILIKTDKNEMQLGESVTLFISVLDTDNKVFQQYTGQDFVLTASNTNISLPVPVFTNGKAEVVITPDVAGPIGLTVRDGNKSNTATITVLEKDTGDISVEGGVTTEINIPNSVENKNALAGVKMKGSDRFLLPGKKGTISITALDKDGLPLLNPEFEDDLPLVLRGFGRLEPKVLKKRYFSDGKAKVNFYADDTIGRAEIYLEKYPTEKITFEIIDKAEPVAAFSLVSDRSFQVGKPEVVTIETLDKNGKRTPKSFIGTAKITVESGKAILSQSTLTSEDFIDGVAEIQVTPTKDTPLVLKIRSGVLVGKSDRMYKRDEKEPVFTDVSLRHPNREAIEYLKKKNILKGNPDGSFRPNDTINRAEFAKIILLALKIDPEPATGSRFTDVSKDDWFASYAETAAKHGLINGYPDGTFGPGKIINRAELFTMLDRAVKTNVSSATSFADVPKGAWFASAANFAGTNNLLDFQGDFLPSQPMTRAEVAESVSRFLHL